MLSNSNTLNRIKISFAHFARTVLPEKAPKQVLGIDTTQPTIRFLLLSHQHQQYRVQHHAAITPTPDDRSPMITKMLQQWLNAAYITTATPTVMALTQHDIIKKTIPVAKKLNQQDIEKIVATNIERYLSCSLSDIYLDFAPIGPSANNSQLFDIQLIAARRQLVDPILQPIQRAGLTVKVVDVDSYALARAKLFLDQQKNALKNWQKILTSEESLVLGLALRGFAICI
ncbi:MAG: pilus assembly protein PilM [Gammaproteobacteria bacterium]|nr:pilus assembly protein PilM [Gammaproteobacteria bacterium]